MKQKIILFTILGAIVISYLYADYSQSYKTPQEALMEVSSSDDQPISQVNRIIASSNYDGKATFFFLNGNESISVALLNEGLFGWQLGGISSSDQRLSSLKSSEPVPGFGTAGEKMIYGVTANPKVDTIQVNQIAVAMLPLDFYLEDKKYRGFKLWYVILDKINVDPKIEAFDRNRRVLITN